VRLALGVELVRVEPTLAQPIDKVTQIEQLRLEYRLLGKVDRNFDGKSLGAIGLGGVAARSFPPNCKMNACIYVM
jgi:hypothetical protein